MCCIGSADDLCAGEGGAFPHLSSSLIFPPEHLAHLSASNALHRTAVIACGFAITLSQSEFGKVSGRLNSQLVQRNAFIH